MIIAEQCFTDCIHSPVRSVKARVELYEGSTLLNTFKATDNLISFDIQRVGESGKFFGFGVCQKVNVKLLDTNRQQSITTANSLDIAFGTECDYIYPFPVFKVTQVHRNENTNSISITAYDAIYEASQHTVDELNLPTEYTIEYFANAVARFLGLPLKIIDNAGFDTNYAAGANFEGSETLRIALNAVAEATQTIYYIDGDWNLVFKRLDRDGAAVYEINKDRYFNLTSGENRRLGTITHTTTLGDNVSVSTVAAGSTQYVRNNPFWDLRDDINLLLDAALVRVGGTTVNIFDCSWRGNYLLEIGDKIDLITKDNDTKSSFLLDDVISYNGTLSGKTKWTDGTSQDETESNPSTLGDVLKQTYARVDKANKEIELVVSDVDSLTNSISSLKLDIDSINASVENVEQLTSDSFNTVNENINTLTSRVNAAITAEDVQIQIETSLDNGIDKVTTSTGYTFDDTGLTVSKSGSEMSTQITDNGMQVFRDGTAVLTANNVGVDAANLHATTYLIIGDNSRLEDYGSNRTGCFWIGG